MIKNIYQNIAATYVEYFVKYGECKTIDFIFGNKFTLAVLNNLYDDFVKDGIEELAYIDKNKKDKYWQVACVYYREIPDRLKASKSLYVLELITSTF